jgi:hypothetical protein
MTDIPELIKRQFASAIPARVRKRLMAGRFESGDDSRTPEGPAIALLRIAARHPRILRENLRSAA